MNKIDFYERLKTAHDPRERVELANNIDCPLDMLKMFIEYDHSPEVITTAALNINCPDELLPLAAKKADWGINLLIKRKREILKEYYSSETSKDGEAVFSNRDAFLISHILEKDNKHADIHLGNYEVKSRKSETKLANYVEPTKEHVVLVICPSWGIIFPPYNIAKISALLRTNGYRVTVFDLNIASYHILKQKTGVDFWRSDKYHLWFDDKFKSLILPHLKDHINDIVEKIIKLNPSVVGFSVYNTNMWYSKTVMDMIKTFLPQTVIVIGGPEANGTDPLSIVSKGVINYIFKGEAEKEFLDFLEIRQYSPSANKVVMGSLNSRLKLEEYPFSDYSDFNLDDYLYSDGLSIETSRGCIAQCSFCSETEFWKFRNRNPAHVVDEIKYQVETHGIRRFWFVDSLVNGNLRAFRELVKLLIDNNVKINWNSYARCDGRMDRDFIFDIAKSGCTCLSFGVESGSQKVLDDMRKKVEVWEAEENLKNCHDAGITAHVNWVIGFPTENNLNFLHSMQFIWNNIRHIDAISPGMGCCPAPNSDLENKWKVYGITWKDKQWDNYLFSSWYTEGYKNTSLHRMIRIKLFAVLLDLLKNTFGITFHNGHAYDDISKFYELNYNCQERVISRVEPIDGLNLNIFNGENSFANSVANEYIGLAWLLHLNQGQGFQLKLNFDPSIDLENFGTFIALNYTAEIEIYVESSGNFEIRVNHLFKHHPLVDHPVYKERYEAERMLLDMSFNEDVKFSGNFKNFLVNQNMAGECIHPKFKHKIITLVHE